MQLRTPARGAAHNPTAAPEKRKLIMAHFLSQSRLLNRRHVLRGMGVSLALPLLNCMRPLRAAEKDARPRRSVFIYLPNGVNTNDYELAKAGKDYELSRILKPLAPTASSFRLRKIRRSCSGSFSWNRPTALTSSVES